MNPLAPILVAFAALRLDITTRFNAALSKLPPIEQLEGGGMAVNLLREIDWAKERIERMGGEVEATINAATSVLQGFEKKAGESIEVTAGRLHEALMAHAATAALTAAVTAKTHVLFDDHKTALDNVEITAKAAGKTEAETDFNARVSDLQTITERRTAAIEKVGVIAAAAIKDSDLLGEGHADILASVEGRVTKLATVGVTHEAKPKSFASLLACGYDEAGIAEFESRFEVLAESAPAANLTATQQKQDVPKPASKFGVLPGSGDPAAPAKKPVI